MAKQMDGNGKINNTQRKVLANLAVDVLNAKIQLCALAIASLRALAIASHGMDLEIENMERQIAALLKKREQLGFSRYNDSLMPGSQAKILVDKRTGTASEKVRRLEERKTDAISRIWTADTMSEALTVLEEAKAQ